MIKKICFYIFLFFCLLLNIFLDTHIKNYITTLEQCFGKSIVLDGSTYALICFIIALIFILIITDLFLITHKKNDENIGINFKQNDGTHGTAKWMDEKEMSEVLSFEKPGIILGKYNNKFVRLPFDSYFNKNACIFGSSGSMKTIRIPANKFVRAISIQKIHYCHRS